MRGLHFLLSIFVLYGFCYPAMAADGGMDFLQEEIEGVTLSMNVQDAKTTLEKRGYTLTKEEDAAFRFRKDDKYEVSIEFLPSYRDKAAPLARDVTTIIYNELVTNIIDTNAPDAHYSCPKAHEVYKRFCPQAGKDACLNEPGLQLRSNNLSGSPFDKSFSFATSVQVNQRCMIMLMSKQRPRLIME